MEEGRKGLFRLFKKKTEKSRRLAHKAQNTLVKQGYKQKIFLPWETREKRIREKDLLPYDAYNSAISRFDLRKLAKENGKDFKNFTYIKGTTTIEHVLDFVFSR